MRTRASLAVLLLAPLNACNRSAAPVREPAATTAQAPLAPVTYSSRRGSSLSLGDRLPLFDRLAFSSPSAVIHDPVRDVYWVSNTNADGSERKGKGFISRLDPLGAVSTLNFIDSRRPEVQLDTPLGLAVSADTLFVADVTAIRRFKAADGSPDGNIEIPGARFLSDVAVAPSGTLYAVDVGSDPDTVQSPAERADAVYEITSEGAIKTVAQRPDLGGPIALIAENTGLWITCAGSTDLLLLIPGTGDGNAADAGRLDLMGTPRGLAAMPDGTLLISSVEGVVYRGFRDGPFSQVVGGLESPADLGYDSVRKRLLIPLLAGHALAVFELAPLPSAAP